MDALDLSSIPDWFYDELGEVSFTTVSWFGVIDQRPATRKRFSTNDYWMLLVPISGELMIEYCDCKLSVTSGQGCILQPGHYHVEQTITQSILGRFPIVAQCGNSFPRSPLFSLPSPAVMPLANPESACARIEEVRMMSKGQRRNNAERIMGNCITNELVLNALAGGFSSGIYPKTRDGTAYWINDARRLLMDDYNNPDLSVELLAEAVNRSVAELQRQFKAAYHYPPKEWLHRYRTQIALHLLMNHPELTISSIMKRCGYRTRSLFYLLFERYQGYKPGEVRKARSSGQ